jgi:hypothetical protein
VAGDVPTSGKIVIEWRRLTDGPTEEPGEEFDWKVDLDPPALGDEATARLLHEIADRF